MNQYVFVCLLFVGVVMVACTDTASETAQIRVELIDNDVRRTYVYEDAISVGEFLRRVEADLGELDEVSPSRFTQLEDGMTITIVRKTEDRVCFEENVAFETRRIPTDALDPGAEVIAQMGENGIAQICERCIFENGIQASCSETSTTVIQEPREQLIYFGTGGVDVPISLEGKLAYLVGGQAYFIEGNARDRRPLTVAGGLDGRVFDLSANGRQLLFTRYTDNEDDEDFTNELWAILDTANPEPVRLLTDNVLSGGWYPDDNFTITYSTAEPSSDFPGWQAYNDLYLMRIDSQTGQTIDLQDIVGVNSLGVYSYWGANYSWSPDGNFLAWSRADSIGLYDLENRDFVTLTTFPHYQTAIEDFWVWQPELSWSRDGQMLITTVHGPPYGGESPVNSVIFDVAVLDPERNLIIENAIEQTGIWAQPQYSPIRNSEAGFPEYQIAFFQARDPFDSLGGEYDLIVADRDGSNPRRIFPPEGRPGIRPFNETQPSEFVWSPSGTHIAVIYQGNLWIVEVSSGVTQQITIDGQASHPRWAN